MTFEELKTAKQRLTARDKEIETQMGALSKEQHKIHQELREYYAKYVNEHFPYKIGDVLKYSFVNSSGDLVSRYITITEISAYRCLLSEIEIFYTYKGLGKTGSGRVSYVNIDGKPRDINETLEKI